MNFRRIYATVVIDLKHFFRESSSVFFVLLFPILLILLFGFIFQGQGDVTYDLHIQNLDDGEYSQQFIFMLGASFNDTQLFEVQPIPANENVTEYFDDNNLNTVIVIPEDFTEHIIQMNDSYSFGLPTTPIPITVIYDDTNTAAMTKVAIFNSMVESVNE